MIKIRPILILLNCSLKLLKPRLYTNIIHVNPLTNVDVLSSMTLYSTAYYLLVSLLEAPQVRVKTAMACERLQQIKADFSMLSVQPGGELRDQAVGPSPGLPSILADGLLCSSDFLQVVAGKLLAKLKGVLPFLRQ